MEKISAFMDGESGQLETRETLRRLKQNEDCYDTWRTFHLIGDVMRGDRLLKDDFLARFRARMEHEPTQFMPRVTWRKSAQVALSVAATLAGVAVVFSLAFTNNPLRPQAPIAIAPPAAPTIIAEAPPRPRPAPAPSQSKINEYLMAHQEFSPSTALQGVVPYVRTVAETHDGSGR